jgi:FMN reductase
MSIGTTPLQITVLCGNPRRGSRTLAVAERVADALADAVAAEDADPARTTIDLASLGSGVFDPSAIAVGEALVTVRSSDLLVVATPVYKGSYTGLLKTFLDELPHRALDGVTAVPVTVQGAPDHLLAVDVHLRPLLVELGAGVPTRAVALLEEQLAAGGPDPVRLWADTQAPLALQSVRSQVAIA